MRNPMTVLRLRGFVAGKTYLGGASRRPKRVAAPSEDSRSFDVDPVAEEVVAIDDHIADIDPNAERDVAVCRLVRGALGHPALPPDRAAYRVHDAGKLHQNAIVGGLVPGPKPGDARIVRGDLRSTSSRCSAFSRATFPSLSAPISRE